MPQFETERAGAPTPSVGRALDAADAVRRAWTLSPEASVEIGEAAGPQGWQDVQIDGRPAGRVRPHARMRFRRD